MRRQNIFGDLRTWIILCADAWVVRQHARDLACVLLNHHNVSMNKSVSFHFKQDQPFIPASQYWTFVEPELPACSKYLILLATVPALVHPFSLIVLCLPYKVAHETG